MNVRLFMLARRNFLVLLILAVFLHQLIYGPSSYKSNDDAIISLIASGGFDGVPSGRLVFVNFVLGLLLSRFYILVPDVSWYAVFQVLSLLLSALVFFKTFTRYLRVALGGQLNVFLTGAIFLFAVLFLKWNMSSINYSSTAFQCSVFGLGSLLLAVKGNFAGSIWLSGFVAVLGFLWRQESFLGALIFFIPLIVISFFFDGRIRKLKAWFSLAFVILSTYLLDLYMYLSDDEWANYYYYNKARGALHENISFEKVINGENFANNLADAGMTRESFNLFINWFFEPKTMSLEAIRYLGSLTKGPKSSAILLEMVSAKTIVPIVGATFLVCAFGLFFKLRLKLIISLTLVNAVFLAFFWSYFSIVIRLPSYVAVGIRLSFFVVLLVTLLIFSQIKTSNVQIKTARYQDLPQILTSILVFVVLVSFADWRADLELESRQEKFQTELDAYRKINHLPILGLPSPLVWNDVSPFAVVNTAESKIIPYSWYMNSPIGISQIKQVTDFETVSRAVLKGQVALTTSNFDVAFWEEKFLDYFYSDFGVCGEFDKSELIREIELVVFESSACSGSLEVVGSFDEDEGGKWSLAKEFDIKINNCFKGQFLKTVTFGLFSPFGQYATDRLVAIEYVDEFGGGRSENYSVKAFQNNRFTIQTLGCRIGIVSLTEPIIPIQVNPEYQDQRTLYLGISSPSLLTGYRQLFKL